VPASQSENTAVVADLQLAERIVFVVVSVVFFFFSFSLSLPIPFYTKTVVALVCAANQLCLCAAVRNIIYNSILISRYYVIRAGRKRGNETPVLCATREASTFRDDNVACYYYYVRLWRLCHTTVFAVDVHGEENNIARENTVWPALSLCAGKPKECTLQKSLYPDRTVCTLVAPSGNVAGLLDPQMAMHPHIRYNAQHTCIIRSIPTTYVYSWHLLTYNLRIYHIYAINCHNSIL